MSGLNAKAQPQLSTILSIACAAGMLPLAAYFLIMWSAPSVDIAQASERVRSQDPSSILVDIRGKDEFSEVHLVGSTNWPLDQILSLSSPEEIPSEFSNRTLFVICQNGLSSAIATRKLHSIGLTTAYNVRGGLQAWIAQDTLSEKPNPSEVVLEDGGIARLPRVELSRIKQYTVLISLFSIKPLYMLLCLGHLVLLWRERTEIARALRSGLMAFFVGELFCWVNFTFFKVESIYLEYFHSFSMVVMLACLTWAAVELLDKKILKFSATDARCALLGVCPACAKGTDVPCGVRRFFRLSAFSLGVLAFIPLTAPLSAVSYNVSVFALQRNLMHPTTIQFYEFRISPLIGLAFLLATLVFLFRKRTGVAPLEKIFFPIALGHLGFGFLRLAFLSIYRDDIVWFVFWEEGTELLLMAGLLYLAWAFKPELLRRFLLRSHPISR